ncbi:MAG: iron-sulfur cluster assembly scaffold protein [Desulfococcaceae bacterium]
MNEEKDLEPEHRYSLRFLETAFRTDHRERIAHPDGYGKRTGDCGDTIEIFLSVQENLIRRICFDINGCINTAACANAIVCLAEGKSPNDAWRITPEHIAQYLETLPPDHFHCAELAAGALYLALTDYRKTHCSCWKKAYCKRLRN